MISYDLHCGGFGEKSLALLTPLLVAGIFHQT